MAAASSSVSGPEENGLVSMSMRVSVVIATSPYGNIFGYVCRLARRLLLDRHRYVVCSNTPSFRLTHPLRHAALGLCHQADRQSRQRSGRRHDQRLIDGDVALGDASRRVTPAGRRGSAQSSFAAFALHRRSRP